MNPQKNNHARLLERNAMVERNALNILDRALSSARDTMAAALGDARAALDAAVCSAAITQAAEEEKS